MQIMPRLIQHPKGGRMFGWPRLNVARLSPGLRDCFILNIGDKFHFYTLPHFTRLRLAWYWAKKWAPALRLWPVYYECAGTDCDGYSFNHLYAWPTGLHAVRGIDHAYDWADGPMHFYPLTRAQYKQALAEREGRA